MNLFDDRWLGKHGIGRFAAEILPALDGYLPARMGGRPSDPVEPVRLALNLRRRRAQFFFSPGYNAPMFARCPFAFTVHDLNHISVPENGGRGRRLYYEAFLRPAIHRAAVVLTVSEFSRSQICDWAGIDPSRVVNVSNGVSDHFCAGGPVYEAGGKPYFVALGSTRTHKNFGRVIAGFRHSGLCDRARLVVVGEPSAPLREIVSDAGLDDAVTYAGVVEDEVLAQIYRGAIALVFPSLYEGFGLPVVEAMASGTAVITSDVAAMPEVAGGAALLVDPKSSPSVGDAMRAVLEDAALRQRLVTLGAARASSFSWEATVTAVARALKPWQAARS